MRQILLVEPGYKCKYPPLGLMKIARYHKLCGDNVLFVKGKSSLAKANIWDRIYISTLFSFYWRETIDTINFYKRHARTPSDVFIGGILASILYDKLKTTFPEQTIIQGLLNKPGILDHDIDIVIDALVPDYTILEHITEPYFSNDAYFAYMTRGCVNRCPFCAVHKLEPDYVGYLPISDSIKQITSEVGQKKDLLLLDNNVLASKSFDKIIAEIVDIGFGKGAKLGETSRHLDFNQGIDLRLMNKAKMELLSNTAIRPLRLAFDHIKYKAKYVKAVEMAAKVGILHLSNYILYNYEDSPADFYERLRINVELNERLGTKIYSFPMKYIPITETDRRRFIGEKWTWKMIRGVQCVLNATRGLVSPKLKFFEAAFGRNIDEFHRIINMPERYILYRMEHAENGAAEWNKKFGELNKAEKELFLKTISSDRYPARSTGVPIIDELLIHYVE